MKNKQQNSFSVHEQLQLFLARKHELLESQLIKKGFNVSLQVSFNQKEGLNVKSQEPNEDDLRSFLTIYRKFISKDSPIFFYKIVNSCQLNLNNEQLKNKLIKIRRLWKNEFNSGFIKLRIDQRNFTPEEIMDLWINASYFHDDLEKIELLENIMSGIITYTAVRHTFLNLIIQTTKYIRNVGYIIELGIKENHFNSII